MIGPLFTRDVLVAPRTVKHFGMRAGYVAALGVLMYTAAANTYGLQQLRNLGDIATYGAFVFELIVRVELLLVIAGSLLLTAGAVAQEKDRRTLILLLMTDLRSAELVIGKALAALLPVFVVILASFPVLCCVRMLGGVGLDQIIWVQAICLSTALLAASWGMLVAYWKEKTFQILSISFLGAILFLGAAEAIALGVGMDNWLGRLAASGDPFRALHQVVNPLAANPGTLLPMVQAWESVIVTLTITSALTIYTCLMVRVWNPSREIYHLALESTQDAAEAKTVARQARPVWATPIIWREICTQAYGKRVGLIKVAYYLFSAVCILLLSRSQDQGLILGMISAPGFVFVILTLVALILTNAQAVTSLTSERDGQTLELLLVTEVSAKEFVFGKLGGILYNVKEVIIVPLLFTLVLWTRNFIGLESTVFVTAGYLVLVAFAAMLGLHAGLAYEQSRAAIANSLGTMFFLFVGVFICMMLIVEARSSLALQFTPFLLFIGGGSMGLWASLTHKNPSPALTLSSCVLPFMTFYSITSFLLHQTAAVCLAIVVTYGFTTIAMLVPAVSAFDVVLGRASAERG